MVSPSTILSTLVALRALGLSGIVQDAFGPAGTAIANAKAKANPNASVVFPVK
jgi:hypothetical protein